MYNKKDIMVFVENIHTLANLYGMKIGEVEDKAGISKGYVSRLKKAGETINIQDDTVKKIADVFGCSTNAIMCHNLKNMGKDDIYYFDFVLKLYDETKRDIITWNFQETKDLITKEEYENHPYKFFYEYYYDSDDKDKCYSWISRFLLDEDDCFYVSYPSVWTCEIEKDTELMLISFGCDADLEFYGREGAYCDIAVELYLNKNGSIVPLCADYNDNELSALLFDFFRIFFSFSKHEYRPRLTDDIREIIDNYMGKEKEDA